MQDANMENFHKAFAAIDNGQFAECYQYLAGNPAATHLHFGHWLLQNSHPVLAGQWFKFLLEEDFPEPQLAYWCGVCFSAAGAIEQAEHYLNQSIKQHQLAELPYVALAQMYQIQGNIASANTTLKKMLGQFPNDQKLWVQSGALFMQSHDYAIAITYFKYVIQHWPDNAMALNDLGSCYQHLGNFEFSHNYFQKALSTDPQIAGAYLGLATSRKYSDKEDPTLRFIDQLKKPAEHTDVQACYRFAKAKILDDMGDYRNAWQQIIQANAICEKNQPTWSSSKWSQNIATIINHFPKLNHSVVAPENSPIPIFIIGMPRSGTTLVEKLLSQFDGLSIAGELDGFDHILGSLTAKNIPTIQYPASFTKLSDNHKQQLRSYYLRLLTAKSSPNSRWVVDKNPLNFIHLGLIQEIFPEAIFIHNKRQPMDILLSNYFQYFAHPNLSYSFNIDNIIQFIHDYHALMAHWLKLLDLTELNLIELNYSEVVSNTPQMVDKLQRFLGISNEESQPNKDFQQEIITTASIWQARQPIYSSSIERWKYYQKDLQPYLDNLKTWI